MSTPPCPTPRTLSDFVSGALDPAGGLAVSDHLDECPACERAYLALCEARTRPTPLRTGGVENLGPVPVAARADDLPACDIPDTRLIREVGRGGEGVVYLASHLGYGEVAVKLTPLDPSRPGHGAALLRDVEAARSLNGQPNAVTIHEAGLTDGGRTFYRIMRYVPGGSLAGRGPDTLAAPREAARLVLQLARQAHAMHTAGAEGWVHGDIKPGNALLDASAGKDSPLAECQAALCDFGMSRRSVVPGQDGPPTWHAFKGTPGYAAPEVVGGEPGTRLSDVYGLGATLYWCLTGEAPFQKRSEPETLVAARTEVLTSPRGKRPECPRPLAWIAQRCLERDPAWRYPSAAALADDLQRYLDTGRAEARDYSPARKAGRAVKAHPWATTATSAGLFAALVAIGFLWQGKLAAERETALLKQAAAVARVEDARRAAARGAWPEAVRLYDRAVADAGPDAPTLRVERLVGLFATNRTDDLERELAELSRLDLGPLAAQLDLQRGAWLMCDANATAEGKALVRRALERRADLVARGDAAFAEALAAERTVDMLAGLRRAAAENPLHFHANTCLGVLLAICGETEEARRVATYLGGVFPESGTGEMVETILAFSADSGDLDARLAAWAARLPPEARERVEPAGRMLRANLEARRAMEALLLPGQGMPNLGRFARVAGVFRDTAASTRRPFAAPVPVVGAFFARWKPFLEVCVRFGPEILLLGTLSEKSRAAVQHVLDDYPEKVLMTMLAADRLRHLPPLVNRADPKAIALANEIGEDVARADAAPTVVPETTIPDTTLGLSLLMDITALKLQPVPPAGIRQRLARNLGRVQPRMVARPASYKPIVTFCLAMATAPLTPAQARAYWKTDTAAGRDAQRAREGEVLALTHLLIGAWDQAGGADAAQLRRDLEAHQATIFAVPEALPAPRPR